MTKISFALVFSLLSASIFACEYEYYGVRDNGLSAETTSVFTDCSPKEPSLNASKNNHLDYDSLGNAPRKDYEGYWSDWVLKTESNPFLSQHYSDSYFGIGVWSPTEFEDEEELTTQEWLMNHGLQFSVGFGEKKLGEPRLRFDYMWHEDEQDNVMMQVEVPF